MVNTSLFSGLSGLRAHQSYIDVIGANLANVSTAGYRGSRVTFADLLSITTSPGARPEGDFGGTNPRQIGLGTSIGSIDVNTRQGTFKDTGRPLDVALEGRGFFAVTDGVQTYYSRAGTFGVDANGSLVDLRNGFRVLGASGSPIDVPVTDTLPAAQSTRIQFNGSLPATVNGPLREVVQSEVPFLAGTAATKVGGASGGSTFDMTAWLDKTVLVSINGRSARQVTFTAGMFGNVAAATASEVAAAFDPLGSDLTVTADDATGGLTFATMRLGDNATLKFDDETGSTGLLAHLGLDTVLSHGDQSAADANTDLASLTTRDRPYGTGDGIRVTGTNPDGTPFSATFVYGTDGTTLGNLSDFIDGLTAPGTSSLSIDAEGRLVFTATETGEASLSLHIGDAQSPPRNTWPGFEVSQEGTGPDTATASIDVFDSLGRAHAVNFEFVRSEADPTVWNLQASMDPSDGTITSDEISSIRFNADGSFSSIAGGTSALSFTFDGIGATQTVQVDLGSAGGFDGVTMLGDDTSVAATDQDGFAAGTLLSVGFDQSGNLSGYYSNGQNRVIDTLRIAMFQNEEGLQRAGDTLWVTAPNSDDPIAAAAGVSGAGLIRPGSLENSNVDIAEEFVSLIEAQRGFQANSRVITTTDEILAELVNIVS